MKVVDGLKSRLANILRGLTSVLEKARVSFLALYQRSGIGPHFDPSVEELRDYWRAYGGFSALIRSPVLWAAFLVTIISYPLWQERNWADLPLQVLPNLLGFSLGSLAIILAIPGTKLFKEISEDGRTDSFYIELSAKFVHFIIAQVLAIIIGLLSKVWSLGGFLWMFGFWVFVYAILTAVMTALALFGVAQIYNHPGVPKE